MRKRHQARRDRLAPLQGSLPHVVCRHGDFKATCSVTYDPTAGSVSVQSLDYDIGDQPVDAVVENTNDDLYVGTDFGVDVLPSGGTALSTAANSLPVVTVSSLTVNPSAHQLLAATHGRGAFQLTLPWRASSQDTERAPRGGPLCSRAGHGTELGGEGLALLGRQR